MEFKFKLLSYEFVIHLDYVGLGLVIFALLAVVKIISFKLADREFGYETLMNYFNNKSEKFILNFIFLVQILNLKYFAGYLFHRFSVPFYVYRANKTVTHEIKAENGYYFSFMFIGNLIKLGTDPIFGAVYGIYSYYKKPFLKKFEILCIGLFMIYLGFYFMELSVNNLKGIYFVLVFNSHVEALITIIKEDLYEFYIQFAIERDRSDLFGKRLFQNIAQSIGDWPRRTILNDPKIMFEYKQK